MSDGPVTVDAEGNLSIETDPANQLAYEVAKCKPCMGCGITVEQAQDRGLGMWQSFGADGTLEHAWSCDTCYAKQNHIGPVTYANEPLEVPYAGCVCAACQAARGS